MALERPVALVDMAVLVVGPAALVVAVPEAQVALESALGLALAEPVDLVGCCPFLFSLKFKLYLSIIAHFR